MASLSQDTLKSMAYQALAMLAANMPSARGLFLRRTGPQTESGGNVGRRSDLVARLIAEKKELQRQLDRCRRRGQEMEAENLRLWRALHLALEGWQAQSDLTRRAA